MDPETGIRCWQGAWLAKLAMRDAKGWSAYTGTFVALEFTGDTARLWDASTGEDHQLTLTFVKPCVALRLTWWITFCRNMVEVLLAVLGDYAQQGAADLPYSGRSSREASEALRSNQIATLGVTGDAW